MKRYAILEVGPGAVILAASRHGLSELVITRRTKSAAERLAQKRWPEAAPDPILFPALREQLRAYFAGQRVRFDVKLDLDALTPFQRSVLRACARIRYGATMTYGQLADRVGHPGAARAVGGALARNPVPLVIPCHRVVAADGSLGGFSAEQGVALKRWLLDLEAAKRPSSSDPAMTP
ncbi:MAG: methylated-DNA--[protein]-cysteine S-methyltransferase [Phycisphaerae bacterium]|nr:methylated-DNA--[protein]-cysteine S-methyltransferase [Phycisphaerae bacterium]